jgi:hypothetical protein
MSNLDYYVPKEWTLLAEIDESEAYEVDITEIYRHGDKFILATASGCSCWSGEYDVEEFTSLDALADAIGIEGPDRRYQPSLKAAADLIAQARAAL